MAVTESAKAFPVFAETATQLSSLAYSLVRLVSGAALPPPSSDPPQLVQALEGLSEQKSQRTRAAWWRMQNEAGAFSWKEEDVCALSGLAASRVSPQAS